jgi:hypothetical protein
MNDDCLRWRLMSAKNRNGGAARASNEEESDGHLEEEEGDDEGLGKRPLWSPKAATTHASTLD